MVQLLGQTFSGLGTMIHTTWSAFGTMVGHSPLAAVGVVVLVLVAGAAGYRASRKG